MRQHCRLGIPVVRRGINHSANIRQILFPILPGLFPDFNFLAEIKRLRFGNYPNACGGRRVKELFGKFQTSDLRVHENADFMGLYDAEIRANGFYVVGSEKVNKWGF
jgi:hypothetical protein